MNNTHGRGDRKPTAYICWSGSSGIPAMTESSGTYTPGSAEDIAVYRINSDGELEDSGQTLTVYNTSSSAVAASVFIHVKREWASHRWIVDFEDCG